MPSKKEQERTINIGSSRAIWVRDPSGLWHYKDEHASHEVQEAADRALRSLPSGPAWFWWNGDPTPIYEGDTVETLLARWDHWLAIRETGTEIMALLQALHREGGRGRPR